MSAQMGTVQPATFAQIDAWYTSTAARCICGDGLTLQTDGQWLHYGRRVWCRALTR